ncbi:DUF3159 domain-containing protein [Streptomyces sp. NPDC004111]|uniref:DUF3159 domain-containing protein n=1 Tax=Streptomyces sp. NPDC004111 TaxID=3364690 RepID=UPI0036B46CD6
MALSYCTRPPQDRSPAPGPGADRPTGRDPDAPDDRRHDRPEQGPGPRGGRLAPAEAPRRRPTLWEETGGPVGLFLSSFPSVAFVLVNSSFGLRAGIAAAVGTVIAFTVLRAVRRQPVKPALAGIVGVAISSYFAARSGEARDFFVTDIWWSLGCCAALVLSLLLRRPLAGVLWSAANRTPMTWRYDPPSRFGYDLATAVLALVFGARFAVQYWLYDRDLAGWLAFAKIAMNYPLWVVALAVWAWAVRRANRRSAR